MSDLDPKHRGTARRIRAVVAVHAVLIAAFLIITGIAIDAQQPGVGFCMAAAATVLGFSLGRIGAEQ